ncbi:PREDICTED: uncharacterized protein LOC106750171 [Dinoponera quadriceps]|uniref:Uncharacterized protein LOC106750171 n=1 Tax=Dinoponera quadriceps TaxID=609295 RepID=A0A6P3Y652_DINQU|nr:PREDICTED: uncharacterized protein LOC106750171 [Dinoponera quadriceps]
MQLLSLNFLIYSVSGIWRPVEWSSSCAKLLYNAFTIYTILSLYLFTLTQFMDILLIVDNVDDFSNNSLMFVSCITVCCKSTIIVLRRNAIIDLVEMLLRDPYKPCNEDELAIQATFDKFIRLCSIKYLLLAEMSVIGAAFRALLNATEGHLPYRAWLPYDWNKSPMFLVTIMYQLIAIFLGALVNVGTETMIFGLILQTCAQLDILKSRLNKSVIKTITGYQEKRSLSRTSKKRVTISELIRHHLSIYRYANKVNSVFNQVLFVQFFGSIIVLCTSVYYVVLHIRDKEAPGILAFNVCMFVQIFVYCWSGNEVILKSASLADAVYNVDWSSLSIRERKDLLMIMMRSTVPIKFTSSFLITLSLESYSNILKTSYSAFSVLQSLCGIWRPVEWSSSCAKLLYNAFTVYTIVSLYVFTLTQFMDILLIVDNVDDFSNNSLMFVTFITVCCKSTIVILRRNSIIDLVEMLLRDPYKPRNKDELAIQTTFDKFIRLCSIKYLLLATLSLLGGMFRALKGTAEGNLPFRVWLPYDWNKSPMFLITIIHQLITVLLGTLVNVGTETVVFGLILQTSAQLDIFKCRINESLIKKMSGYQEDCLLSRTNKKQATISKFIRHHLSIYTYANKVNSVFNQVLFVQFFGSILVLCTCVYYVSMHIGETEATGILAYTICMFVQIFVYCWSGNEVTLKVQFSTSLADAVYEVDWSSLSIRERKDLLMIMMRSTVPIKFTSSFLITLSLESYSNILKTSYSAFSVLQS